MADIRIELREVKGHKELKACEGLEQLVWGMEDMEITPASHLIAVVHSGGMVGGAFLGERLVGFVYGFPAIKEGKVGMHSHLLAVHPDFRGAGLGKALKWYQRAWCLTKGFPWMTWTYDPLQAKNARLNLEHLGATVSEYHIDVYGRMGGILNADLPTDRFLAYWDLASERVTRLSQGSTDPEFKVEGMRVALRAGSEATQVMPHLDLTDDHIRIDVPENLNEILLLKPEEALGWRLTSRAVFMHYFARGYKAARFSDNSYILER